MHKLNYALIAIMPFIIILASFRLLAFDENFYQDELTKNRAYPPLSFEEASTTTYQVVGYLKTGNALETELLTDNEKLHMQDVRQLMQISVITLYALTISALAIAIILLYKRQLAFSQAALYAGAITATLIVIKLLILNFTFSYSFTLFHKLLFTNGLWLLPADSNLLKLFPTQFFIDFTKRLGLYTILISAIVALTGKFTRG